jgi:DNA-binding HxlR family transcriptional regulator
MSYRCKRCEPLPEEVRWAAEILGRRWALALLYAAHAGAVRFNEFKQVLEEIPPGTLAQRLSELEDAGLVERDVVDSRPPRVEYRLTPKGRRLKAVVDALRRWAVAQHSTL